MIMLLQSIVGKTMKLLFITTNKHKVEEIQKALEPYGIIVEQRSQSYHENHDDSIEEIAAKAAKQLAEELQQPVMVDDSGVFFSAYPCFPGAIPKIAFNGLGYEGLLKLLEGKTGKEREAVFVSCIGYCEPGKDPHVFRGELKGIVIDHVEDLDKDVLAYDRIVVPEGDTRTVSKLSIEEKNAISQRAKAAEALAHYLLESRKL